MKRSQKTTPFPVKRILTKLGRDIHDARRRRRISTELMAERCSMSRTTLTKIEKGDPSVSMANYATVLYVLGLIDRLGDVADIRFDETGLMLDEESLPKKIRPRKIKPSQGQGDSS